jgi:hypothetical protein
VSFVYRDKPASPQPSPSDPPISSPPSDGCLYQIIAATPRTAHPRCRRLHLFGASSACTVICGWCPWLDECPQAPRAQRCSTHCGAPSTRRNGDTRDKSSPNRQTKHTAERRTLIPPRPPTPSILHTAIARLHPHASPSCRRSARPFTRATAPRPSTTTRRLTMATATATAN